MAITFERLIGSFRRKSFEIIPPEKDGNGYFFPISYLNDTNGNKYLRDFLEIPELNAILNIRARAMSSAKFKVVSKATGKEVPNNEPLVRVLRSPNWFQGHREFWRQSSLFRDIYGNEYLYFLTPVGMPNNFKGLYTLDPYRVWIRYNSENFYFMESLGEVDYQYRENGESIIIPSENVIHLNDNRVLSTNLTGTQQFVKENSFLKGTSKLKALQPALNNIRDAYRKRGISLNMPIGVLSNGQSDAIGQAVPMDPKEKKKVHAALDKHGAEAIVTNLAVKYFPMNISAKVMGLFEETREDTARVCDAFGVPYDILANAVKGSSLNGGGGQLKEAKKQMYNDGIIPDMNERMNAINSRFAMKSWEVQADFSDNHVFDEDLQSKSTALQSLVSALDIAFQSGAITIDQYKLELQKYGIG